MNEIDPAIQKVEFKTTARAVDEPKVLALLSDQPRERDVYFFDTKALDLFTGLGLVLRARLNFDEDEDDSTVKLRPADLANPAAPWRTVEKIRVELDVVGSKEVPSAKLDGTPDKGEIEAVRDNERSVAKLFSDRQEKLITRCTAIALSDLAVLGPVEARVWELEGLFPHKLAVEKWTLPDDGGHFYELSFKVEADQAQAAEADFHELLGRLKIDVAGDQEPKTPRVLRFFAARL
jgi:hypothetical protein